MFSNGRARGFRGFGGSMGCWGGAAEDVERLIGRKLEELFKAFEFGRYCGATSLGELHKNGSCILSFNECLPDGIQTNRDTFAWRT